MADIKRILWIDDYPKNKASEMFPEAETKIVSTMDEAINEIAGSRLYEYDTIVLDIDFENGLPHGERNILKKLSEKIFLHKDQQTKSFIINNGGYLLFLYLLEKGYPSDQVAFLTGNAGIIGQLRAYTEQNKTQMSKEEIAVAFEGAWQDSKDDLDLFVELIDKLPIDKKYKDSDFLYDCGEKLEEHDADGLRSLIDSIVPSMVTGSIQNTGDMMIFRFHEANLESPVYFSKNDNDIEGHNRADANRWLAKKRTSDNVTRWLLLDSASYIENLYRNPIINMNLEIGHLFQNNCDPGIRSSFRQMFLVFDGLRNKQQRGIYYQAVSAMLIPFDNSPKNSGSSINDANGDYKNVQKMFLRFSKQARNYCAHNYFGSSISNQTVLFIIAGTISGLLTREQKSGLDTWYENMYRALSQNVKFSTIDNVNKIDALLGDLLSSGYIDEDSAHVISKQWPTRYTPWDVLRAFGYNTLMSVSSEQNSSVREEYYVFSLAAYIVKWFYGISEEDLRSIYGEGIVLLLKIAHEIVTRYTYPQIDL